MNGRKSYDFTHGEVEPYNISCTLLDNGGLTYLVVMTQLPEQAASTFDDGE
jgi:hypothetical protein